LLFTVERLELIEMPEEEPLSPGALANREFVASKRAEDPNLAFVIPEGCLECSTAWDQATKGRIDKVHECRGKIERMVGEKAVMLCRFSASAE
jgi:hypothetical protein